MMVGPVDDTPTTGDNRTNRSASASGACDGLSVVEFGMGMAGSMPGMVLADNGADVVKVEPPGGDWSRAEPGFLMWNRGKRGVVLDLERDEDLAHAVALAGRADVVVESFRPGVAERLGIGWTALQDINPALVYCSISGFGPATPYAGLAGYEYLVSAAIGRMVGLDHLSGAAAGQDRQAPLFTSVPVASYGAAQLALQGALAALLRRQQTGRGDLVTTSLVQGAAAFLMRQELPRGDAADRPVPLVSEAMHAGIELCFMTAECQDGRYLQMCARQDLHFHNWLIALGLESLFDDPRFARAPLGVERIEEVAELDGIIRARMATRTQDEWMRVFTTEYDVGCDPFLTPLEFLDHPQMVENGRVVELDDPAVGRCRQVGALVSFSETPSRIERPAPTLGQHTAAVVAEVGTEAPGGGNPTGARPSTAQSAGSTRPLEGVTVVELAYYVAGPLAGSLLAELGARIIKVEPLEGDPYRRTGLQSAKFLHGKESIALNLKAPEGQQVLHHLVRHADIFVHSFRPGVTERLQVDYPTLAAVNPMLTYLYAASYGSKGPQAGRTAFHSTPSALAGGGVLQAGSGNPPVDDSFPDPGSALGVATAMLLGLHARQRTGRGQQLETTMLASTGYIMSPYTVSYPGSRPLRSVDRGQHGFDALNRLYRCSDQWLFICCPRPHEWQALARALDGGDWFADPRFATPERRWENDDVLVSLIGNVLATGPADKWEVALREQGVPATVAIEQPIETWLESQGLLSEANHPIFGQYWRLPPKVDFQSSAPRLGEAAAVGEHSRALLAEIGYAGDAAQGLIDDGVVGVWPSEP